ncbi:hypothetical protein BDZ85DRAFT_299566 [Elsinoe ampelina]|uniref:Uncharacterized protein n=1 Tax=Elsinoe ampelina TaxID=302913 RepID=A0A6A6FYD1_9PEZI|nr:hypothetical protein BDZ85DRAFT_299566 [Elsinoe ampelina]
MSTKNGFLTPEKQAAIDEPTSGTKRKRSDTDHETTDAQKDISQDRPEDSRAVSKETFEDILAILYQSEVGPSILNAPIPAGSQPQPSKKAKLAEPALSKTISEKVAESTYAHLDELEQDVVSICDAQVAEIKKPDESSTIKLKRLSEEDVAQIQDYMSLKSTVRELVVRESKLKGERPGRSRQFTKVNGVKTEQASVPTHPAPEAGRTVLSLYGNAQGPKQLFSSLQDDAATDLSLEELGLPTMLTATKLLPLPQDEPIKTKTRTFADAFPPPTSLPELQPPPKQPKPSSRNPPITFMSTEKRIPRSVAKKMAYPYQPLNVGHWIRYGNAPRKRERSSDKSRDRPGSIVEKERPQDLTPSVPREEDLFASAYSSFAPSYDHSRAVISANSRNLVWWQRGGKRKLDSIFALQQPDDEMEVDATDDEDPVKLNAAYEKKMFEEVIENYDDSLADVPDAESERLPAEMEAQELLLEINDLLQTLASQQRIRNSTIASHARTPSISSPSPMRSAVTGTPSEPAPEEVETYRALKERLAEVIARLPPYTVAKMDGQQIEDLRVSTTILLENKNVRGVLEEDQLTRLTKATQAAAANAATRTSSNAGYNQFARTSSISGSRQAVTPQSYQGNRLPTNYARPSSNLASATPSAQTNRQSYSQAGAQTAPVSRHQQLQPNSYSQSGQQYYQRQNYGQQLNQGSPQPPAQRWPNQYGNTQATYQNNTQFRNSMSYGQNTYNSQSQQGQGYQGQTYNQQRPSSNGRSTPVSNIAPAPPRVSSPMKPLQSADMVARPSSATPQPQQAPQAQMNGVQTNGA